MACCTEVASPPSAGSTASSRPAGWSNRSDTASTTAASATSAPTIRSGVNGWGPAGPSPSLSTTRLLTACPATTATVNTATPITATVVDCVATRNAPERPPRHCHHRSMPGPREAVRTVRQTLATAWRIRGITAQPTSRISSPETKETSAAGMPSPSRCPSSPFSRDWTATSIPIPNAAVSPISWCCCLLRAGRVSVDTTTPS